MSIHVHTFFTKYKKKRRSKKVQRFSYILPVQIFMEIFHMLQWKKLWGATKFFDITFKIIIKNIILTDGVFQHAIFKKGEVLEMPHKNHWTLFT